MIDKELFDLPRGDEPSPQPGPVLLFVVFVTVWLFAAGLGYGLVKLAEAWS